MASAKTWFVQTGFGTVLGPMPDDALQEMVRTGALVRSDQVREGADGEWRPAAEIPDLFAAASVDFVKETVAPAMPDAKTNAPVIPESRPTELDSGTRPIPATPSIKGRLIPPPAPLPSILPSAVALATEPVSSVGQPAIADVPSVAANSPVRAVSDEIQQPAEPPRAAESPAQSAPPEVDLLARWREERDRTREELGAASLAAEMEQSCEEEEDFAPELPSDLLDDEDAVPPVKPASTISEPQTRRREIHRPALLDQVVGLEDGPRVREETFLQKWDRWRRSLPSWPIAVGVVVVLLGAWWFWPRSSHGIYSRYVAIWDEWKTRRDNLKDQAGWTQFLQRVESELNSTVPYLEEHANASDREMQLLLFVGRDCLQKMLQQPKQIGSPREKQLEKLLAVLHQMYEPTANSPPIEVVLDAPVTRRKTIVPTKPPADSKDSSGSRPLQEESLLVRPRSDAIPQKNPIDR